MEGERDFSKIFLSIIIFLVIIMFIISSAKGCQSDLERQQDRLLGAVDYYSSDVFDDIELFGTHNKDYKDLTDENSTEIIVEFNEKYVEQANRAIVNYLSNVGGKLISINDKQISKDTLKFMLGVGFGKEGFNGLGVGLIPGQKIETINRYLIRVPSDAKCADNLQERMDNYIIGYGKNN